MGVSPGVKPIRLSVWWNVLLAWYGGLGVWHSYRRQLGILCRVQARRVALTMAAAKARVMSPFLCNGVCLSVTVNER